MQIKQSIIYSAVNLIRIEKALGEFRKFIERTPRMNVLSVVFTGCKGHLSNSFA